MLNLTLAVINSKFTEAHNQQHEHEKENSGYGNDNGDELESALQSKDEMSIA